MSVDENRVYSLAATYPSEQSSYLGTIFPANSDTQWGMHALKFPHAWDLVRGNAYVGVLDGGLQVGHPDLAPNFRAHLSINFDNRLDASGALMPWSLGFDSIDESAFSASTRGHGSHVSGIIAAATNNAAIGSSVAGGCWHCSIAMMPAGNSLTDVIMSRAILRAIDNGVQVINMSFAGDRTPNDPNQTCSNLDYAARCLALNYAAERGLSLVAAAGNTGNRAPLSGTFHQDLWAFPASHAKTMAISGLERNSLNHGAFWTGGSASTDSGWFGSSYGHVWNGVPQIALAAPAKSVFSTVYTGYDHIGAGFPGVDACGESAGPSGTLGYGWCTGTSMAAPHVSAAAALVKSANPLLGNDAVRARLTATANCPIAAPSNDPFATSPCTATTSMEKLGYGMPNAAAAVKKALGHPNAVNRFTPLFSHFRNGMKTHFYTTVPQMSMAALAGTLNPSPKPRLMVNGAIHTFPIDCSPANPANVCGSVTPTFGLPTVAINSGEATLVRANSTAAYPNLSLRFKVTSSGGTRISTHMWESDSSGKLGGTGYIPTNVDAQGLSTTFSLDVDLPELVGEAFVSSTSEAGDVIPEYPRHPITIKNVSNPNEGYISWDVRSTAAVFSAHKNPYGGSDNDLVALYRVSCPARTACNGADPNHVSFVLTTRCVYSGNGAAGTTTVCTKPEEPLAANSDLQLLLNQGYQIDGIEGYIYRFKGVAPAIPGMTRLCRKWDVNQKDAIIFPDFGGAFSCETRDSFGGLATYGNALNGTVALGYAFGAQAAPKALCAGGAACAVSLSANAHDYTGDGYADIALLSAATNTITRLAMNGNNVVSSTVMNVLPAGGTWVAAGSGDLDGDGFADLVFQHSTNNHIYGVLMNAAGVKSHNYIQPAPANWPWKVAGIGDLDGDGKADIVLQDPTSEHIYLYRMNGLMVEGTASGSGGVTSSLPANWGWRIAGIGDLDGDGKADLILQHNGVNGVSNPYGSKDSVYAWLMNGKTIAGGGSIFGAYSGWNWKVRGVGDIDNDGFADIVLQYDDGTASNPGSVAYWGMQGIGIRGGTMLAGAPSGWGYIVKGVRDLNKDGHADLILQQSVTNGYGTIDSVYTVMLGAVNASSWLPILPASSVSAGMKVIR